MAKNVDNFDVNSTSEKSSIGYILNVDLKYLDELHSVAQWLSISSRKTYNSLWHVTRKMKKIVDEYKIKVCDVKKLIPNLGEKLCAYGKKIMCFITEIFSCICL